MSKITRKKQKIFAGSATNNGVFGSAQAGTKVLSSDIDTIQSLPAYDTGWLDAVMGTKKFPALEEFQALQYMMTSQLAYIFQEGIPEFSSTTVYYTNSVVKKAGTYELYGSLINDNTGNALPDKVSDSNWQYLGDMAKMNFTKSTITSLDEKTSIDGTEFTVISDTPDSDNLKKVATSNLSVPSGTILDFGGTSAPTGFLGCDGSAVSRTTYAKLFAAIGTTWGVGDNSTTFNLPNLSRKTLVGSGGTGTATLANAVGSTGGSETHTLTEAQLPAHYHIDGKGQMNGYNQRYGITDTGVSANAISLAGTSTYGTHSSSVGSGSAHNNMQPSAVVLKIIKI